MDAYITCSTGVNCRYLYYFSKYLGSFFNSYLKHIVDQVFVFVMYLNIQNAVKKCVLFYYEVLFEMLLVSNERMQTLTVLILSGPGYLLPVRLNVDRTSWRWFDEENLARVG